MRKLTAVVLVGLVSLGSVSSPATAKRRCSTAIPAPSGNGDIYEKVLVVTPRHTESQPLTVEFQHAPGVGALLVRQFGDLAYFRIVVRPKGETGGLHVRTEWATPSPDEMDLFLYDRAGEMVAWSDGNNLPLIDMPTEPYGHSGMGYEYIEGYPSGCEGFLVESEALRSPGRDMTLELWLGSVTE